MREHRSKLRLLEEARARVLNLQLRDVRSVGRREPPGLDRQGEHSLERGQLFLDRRRLRLGRLTIANVGRHPVSRDVDRARAAEGLVEMRHRDRSALERPPAVNLVVVQEHGFEVSEGGTLGISPDWAAVLANLG